MYLCPSTDASNLYWLNYRLLNGKKYEIDMCILFLGQFYLVVCRAMFWVFFNVKNVRWLNHGWEWLLYGPYPACLPSPAHLM